MRRVPLFLLFAAASLAQDTPLVPPGWDPALAGDVVMERLVNTSAPRVKGAHDAEFVCVGDHAFIVTEANDVKAGESAGWPFIYVTMSVVNLKTLAVERVIDFARGEQVFENETLPVGACFVPRIIQKDANTLRCYFTSEDPGKRQSQMWHIDFDVKRMAFENRIHKTRIKTAAGTFDMQPQYFHADAAAQGFKRPAKDAGLFIFDSFKKFDGWTYVALNNFPGGQNALARVHDDLATFEVIGHYNEPQSAQLSESAVNRLPDGTWMAICRNDKGNYHFTTSADGKTWSVGREMPFVPNGANSKPTFDKFGGVYYLGWQEATRINDVRRSVFNIEISRDGQSWERKYRFETTQSFQYPTLHEHGGVIWLAVTQGASKERIMFGQLEKVGEFASQAGKARTPLPPPSAALATVDARTEPPVILTDPGPEFQDDARPGAMVIGMDRTPKGRIWGCWTGTGDKRDGYFILATSDDGGGAWSKPRLVVGAPDPTGKRQRGALVGNLWTDPLGRLWLFFDQTVIGVRGPTANWFIRCDNPDADAPTWSPPVGFAIGCTLNKPTVLGNGDWLLPVSHWAEKKAWVHASTDQGKTWLPRGSVMFPDWEFDEHMVVELRDGRLWMLARTKGSPHESFSDDKGVTWSEPKPSAIQNVNARFFLRRLASGKLLLVKNGPPTERLTKRSHLSAFVSDDDGKTWNGGLLLDERSSVSYPDGFQSPDGLIHILYDWNRHTDAEILMARFREEDVLAGQLVSKDAKLSMLANKATGPKPILYNGIELPLEWPPRHLDPASAEPIPVPYLQRPPRVIPIDVGRQLFVDDFLIESTTLTRTFYTAKKFEGNPVFKAETKHELAGSTLGEKGQEAVTYLGHGGVFFDPAEKHFTMFYTAGWRGPLALATSADLKHWTRPSLGILEDNLLLAKGNDAGGDNSVWLDLQSKTERFKFLTDRGRNGHALQTSADGREWSAPVATGKAGDYCSIFHNPFRGVWCYSIKQGGPRGRSRWYSESTDFLRGADWSKSVYWCNADRRDEADPNVGDAPQLYSLSAVAYESIMLGEFQILLGPDNKICDEGKFPKITEIKLGFSRDGFHWARPDRRPFIAATRREGDWDRAYLHGTTGVCVVMNDELWFPFCAYSGIAPSGTRGMYSGASIGLATLRRDGFASMDAGEKSGTLTTRPVEFKGRHFFVNVDAPAGELVVEALDSAGKVIAASEPLSGNRTKQRVAWPNGFDLAKLAGKSTRFRFHLTNGRLYAFWVSSDENGASNGFLGAGGPDFAGVRDVAP